MIVRTWTGRVPEHRSESFARHLMATGVADYRNQQGCREVRMWRAVAGGRVAFTVMSVWDSMECIRNYAGNFPDKAVLYPGDAAYDLDPDLHVSHFELVAAEPGIGECLNTD